MSDPLVSRVRLADGRHAVVKQRRGAPADFFAAEARGLEALRQARALRVPKVIAASVQRIVLEDLGNGAHAGDYWQRAGAGLAAQHYTAGDRFGFGHDGYCGDTPQDNTRDDDGWRFFAARRLLPQMRRARDAGLIDGRVTTRIEHLCTQLRERVPTMPPVLLHGDLWAGNLHACGDGSPALLDAGAVHYGWAESELAMLTLFGAPPDAFFATYAARGSLRGDWRARAPIYNLYHLLNHANLFGPRYLPGVQEALATVA